MNVHIKGLTSLPAAIFALLFSSLAATAAQEEAPPYPPELAAQGEARFAAACGFCHGRDAAGGSRGHDLVRSELVADDDNGDLIGEVVRNGRPNTEMVAFSTSVVSADDLEAIVAFIHNQRHLFATLEGGRRSVLPEDVAIGDADAGEQYFDDHCTACHAANRDLAGIGSRMQGLQLMMPMLNPWADRRGPSPSAAMVTVTEANGQRISGALEYQDEFTIALTLPNGRYRSWQTTDVDVSVEDPLQAHVDQLDRYTDADMHNVLAYLLTLQ